MVEFIVADGETWNDGVFKISYKNLGLCGSKKMFWKMEIIITYRGLAESKKECSESYPPKFTTHSDSISIILREYSPAEIRGLIEDI